MADQVLIVDDDPAICKLLEKVMRSNDMDSQAVGSGEQALQALETRTFDIILLDVNLGDMEGFEVLRRLRERGIKTPVIIISGRNEDYDSLYGLSLGADDYVTKPFRPVVLGAKVKALLLLFLQHPNQVFTKDMLYERVWGTAVAVDDNAIMVYINRLRGKIEPDRQHPVHIRTVRGLGYRFVP